MLAVIFLEILLNSQGVFRASILALCFAPRFFLRRILRRHIQIRWHRQHHHAYQRGHEKLLRVCGEYLFVTYQEYSENRNLSLKNLSRLFPSKRCLFELFHNRFSDTYFCYWFCYDKCNLWVFFKGMHGLKYIDCIVS